MMKKLTRLFAAVAALALFHACAEEMDFTPDSGRDKGPVFTITASVDDASTKTFLDEDGQIEWNAGDAVSLLEVGDNFKFETTESGLRAKFTHTGEMEEKAYYALYPYNASAVFAGGVVTTSIPTVQSAAAGVFSNLALAWAEWGKPFYFKNAAAWAKVSFKTTDTQARIRKVTVRSLDESVRLSGTVTLTPTLEDGAVTDVKADVTDGVPYASYEAAEGEILSPETDYYILVAPGALAAGYRVEFETEDGIVFSKDYDGEAYKAAEFKRNMIAPVGRKNLDAYKMEGYVRLTYDEAVKKKKVGDVYDYLIVYKMGDGDYRILNQRRTNTNVTGLQATFGITTSQLASWVFIGGSVPTGIAHAGSWVFSQAYSPNASSKIVSGADQPSYESDRFILLEDDEDARVRVTITASSSGNGNTKGTATVRLYDGCNKSGDYASHAAYTEATLNNLKITMDKDTDTGVIAGEFAADTFKEIIRQMLIHTSAASYYDTAYNKIASKNTFTAGFKTTSITTAGSTTQLTYNNYFMFQNSGINSSYDKKVMVYRRGEISYADFAADK